MNTQEFQALRAEPRPLLGVSVKVVAPTGQHEEDKTINASANRWATKAELSYTYPLTRRWLLEIEGGVWFLADNDEFVFGTREQRPIAAGELHLVRRIRPGFWASLDANYYYGGRSTIGGVERDDLQRNSRFGGTVVVPYKGKHVFKIGYSIGVVTSSGNDFETLLASYTLLVR